ncbi:MAG TPA: hypothetical protein VK911_09055, partial [Vicinamibacterales bacterium]|nr:hypothetical protein [Vicinamibacterales bacterium]
LRTPAGDGCPPGHDRRTLAGAEPQSLACTDCDPWGSQQPTRQTDSGDGADPIASLEQRLERLERSPLFTVIDQAGRPVFSVAPGRVTAYNAGQQVAATIIATDAGGYFKGISADRTLAASVGASGAQAGVRVYEGDRLRLTLGKQEAGNYSLTVPSGVRGAIAGIGESRAGSGALVVSDPAGQTKASLTLADGKGTAGVFSTSGIAILSLTEGATAAGVLALGDAGGTPMVKMGVNDNRYGVVLAGPVLGFPLVPRSGLPGSYILGCAGGESCGPR